MLTPAIDIGLLHVLSVLAITVRVIMRRPSTGVTLAWISIVAIFPFAGLILYLLFGERRISRKRVSLIAERRIDYDNMVSMAFAKGLLDVEWNSLRPEAFSMNTLGIKTVGFPTVSGSHCELYSEADQILDAITRDIDNAKYSVLMEYYIWSEGGKADQVLLALIRAAKRGVSCCILIDALGARKWWNGNQPKQLRDAGVKVQRALPAGLFRTLVDRTDLRVHRKIVVIDNNAAWTGSMNMVDPKFFNQEANVGNWVDAMVRIEGALIAPLALTVIGDWVLETEDSIEQMLKHTNIGNISPRGRCDAQVIPSGPGETDDGLLQMLLAIINSARHELVLTTPYFVPDESMLRALRGAAARGVKVDLIVPEKVDSLLTRHASHSYYDELLDMGVNIHLYQKGLLHTKSITADRCISMFGTVNLDMRSIWINYEVALFFYDSKFSEELYQLQASYIECSRLLNPVEWAKRATGKRFVENTFRLVSPIL